MSKLAGAKAGGSVTGFRREEQYAVAVVERVLDAHVEQTDVPGAPPGTVDGEIQYKDGRTAALEITSAEDRTHHHLRSRLAQRGRRDAPGTLMWSIHAASVADLDRLVSIHERVILLSEQHGVSSPDDLPIDLIASDTDLSWIAWESSSTMAGYPGGARPRVYWFEPIGVAVFSSEADAIAEGVAAALKEEPSKGHLEKLLRDPHEERHLFLVIGATGLSNAAAFALIEPETLPFVDPDLPAGVDHLWLGPGWGKTATVWSRGIGWRNETVAD